MSAYIVVELTVKNADAKNRYSAAAAPVLEEFGGEIIVGGGWTVLTGQAAFDGGAVIRFPDRETALAWYNSPGYQATFGDRAEGIDCRFRLIG